MNGKEAIHITWKILCTQDSKDQPNDYSLSPYEFQGPVDNKIIYI